MKRFTNLILSYFCSLILLLLLSLLPPSFSSPTFLYKLCYNLTSTGPSTQYLTNLNTLFHSLSSNATSNPTTTGYYTTSVGDESTDDAVYGFFLCRGDQNATSCGNCVQTATTVDLPHKYCHGQDFAMIWYKECMVRYTIDPSSLSYYPGDINTYISDNQKLNVNQTQFMGTLGKMMNQIANQAGNDREKKYATMAVKVGGGSETMLYGLGQCKPDLTNVDCYQCLRLEIAQLKVSTDGYALQGSCFLEFATYPFFSDVNDDLSTGETSHKGKKKISARNIMIIGIVVPLAIISGALLSLSMRYLSRRKAKERNVLTIESGGEFMTIESLQFDLDTLKHATNNFANENKLGVGGFGVVYKGTLKNGQEIAVKRLSKTSARIVEEFKNEVLLVAKLQHKNLVKLFGFCLEGTEKLLVYEYVPHKSLDHFLFDNEKQRQLSWEMRYQIIGGIARGMLYLHQDARRPIIHRDLKASNILLDADMNPKIADFGMARMFDVDQTQAKTRNVAGTLGYMAPEYAMQGQFSVKSDMYSFGVLMLEIICGKMNSKFYQLGHDENLLSYAWKQWTNETPLEFVDPTIRDSCPVNEVMRCLQLGLLCVQHSKDMRPSMATIVHQLESDSASLSVPEQPYSYGSTFIIDEPTIKPMSSPTNNVTITEFEPR